MTKLHGEWAANSDALPHWRALVNILLVIQLSSASEDGELLVFYTTRLTFSKGQLLKITLKHLIR